MKKFKPIIVVAGEPNSIFLEIFLKSLKKTYSSPIILISSHKLLNLQMKKLKYEKKIKLLEFDKISKYILNNKTINLIDINYAFSKPFEKISSKYNSYIAKSFDIAFKIINKGITNKLINGPISKKNFLKKKYLGVTEYIADKYSINKKAMLIYNKYLSVCPVTTHLPLKLVSKKINQKNIKDKIELLNEFYKKNFNIKPKIGVLGLNPHCESIDRFNEDEKIIKPIIKKMKKNNYRVSGPYSADTIFIKNNRKNFDVILGMYHDQVLTPIKTLYEYDAINITLGLPFIRISPDHGPNETMIGKNLSNPLSLIQAIRFLDKN
ncbi:4-hydroxythreonine-4-phosphate dehydrogenase PdxA [Candidatus Pelagibacter sp.]|nr:4-hydroxythreonine-4-phosphate dehydrogenase PdxA [Candidatus Pelagibacter sp.]